MSNTQCVLMIAVPNPDYSGSDYQIKECAKNTFNVDDTNVDVVKVHYEQSMQELLEFAEKHLEDAYVAIASDILSPNFVDTYRALYNKLDGRVRPYLYVGQIGRLFHIKDIDSSPMDLVLEENELGISLVNRFVRTTSKSPWGDITICVPSNIILNVPKAYVDVSELELRHLVDVYRIFRGSVKFLDQEIKDIALLKIALEASKSK